MDNEKRSFSRIDVRMKGYARLVASLETPCLFNADAVEDGAASFPKGSKLPEELAAFLIQMDRKLDRIIGLMSTDMVRNDFPLELEVVEISGAGIKFRSSHNFETGTLMEVVLVVSHMPMRMAGSKGRILAHEPGGIHRFEFVNLRENDLEAIVQFVFRLQREQIRNAKLR